MRRTLAFLAAVIVVGCAALAGAQTPLKATRDADQVIYAAAAAASMIDIYYEEPANPDFTPIYQYLRQREVLEQFRSFLAPLRLKQRLRVTVETCKRVNATYFPAQRKMTMCYEYLQQTRSLAPRGTTPEGLTYDDAIVAAFVGVMLHELGHAVVHLLPLPVLGREEDAADQLAAFVMLQFGKDVARRTITGKAHLWDSLGAKRIPKNKRDFAGVHGTDYQRFYNVLCVAYGSDPKTFDDFVQKQILPPGRAKGCRWEYRQLQYAFQRLVLPHIDRAMMEKVRQVDWLAPNELVRTGRPAQ